MPPSHPLPAAVAALCALPAAAQPLRIAANDGRPLTVRFRERRLFLHDDPTQAIGWTQAGLSVLPTYAAADLAAPYDAPSVADLLAYLTLFRTGGCGRSGEPCTA